MTDADQTPRGATASPEPTPRAERPAPAGTAPEPSGDRPTGSSDGRSAGGSRRDRDDDAPGSSRPSDDSPSDSSGSSNAPGSSSASSASGSSGDGTSGAPGGGTRRRRGSRGGRGRSGGDGDSTAAGADGDDTTRSAGGRSPRFEGDDATRSAGGRSPRSEGDDATRSAGGRTPRSDGDAAPAGDAPPAARPRIGDTRPAPPAAGGDGAPVAAKAEGEGGSAGGRKRRRRGGRGRGKGGGQGGGQGEQNGGGDRSGGRGGQGGGQQGRGGGQGGQQGRGGQGRGGRGDGRGGQRSVQPVTALTGEAVELDDDVLAARRGRERKGKAVGRYLMAVHVQPEATQIAILEGRSLIEHQVSRPADDISQIHGNIYLGKVQNVLPGMEAAFVDIGTPKNAVLYRSDARADDDLDQPKQRSNAKIEDMLRAKQLILCQVTKNPIAHKGARLTQEVSLPGRFVVLVPNSTTYGISKRLPDDERKRLRNILDKVRPKGHGLIVRTAAEGVTASEIEADVTRLASQWQQIEALAERARSQGPTLLYREPDTAIRMIREELTNDFRKVVIDDRHLFEQVSDYVSSISPEMAERVELYDPATEPLPLFEKHHIHEQLHKALDRKVWLPSGGSLIIEHTEALTVIDVNTGKNVGTSSLEQTVYLNNLEAAEEVARQLRLRDIGGIIVIDFIDMEIAKNRDDVIKTFRDALARDKTRTQVFDISQLGLVEMTRKRIGEGLLESFAQGCPHCEGRGVVLDTSLLPKG
ncbi:Rne/Rng family ribonuclease [Iamia sp. SCSIO 61187]|uniref:Rne/Rng family ribonuclease n=1 Tax=Iamia sp. SCSIO 61187 TaxID=2722752 RepID=UPI001C6334B7|nr:Rne/Rng family ribonuclease [Iamia sp. SCSIO 61187]QYG92526.1 Rne/Rng family ribonuclease [Iamia sp. SCSIO 61187]